MIKTNTAAVIAGTLVLPVCATAKVDKPNIIVINVDDLGWNDVNYLPGMKSPYHTPNIQKLAEESMVFTDGYAACPVCSPTRASLVTGKSPAALKLTAHLAGNPSYVTRKTPKDAKFLPAEYISQLPLEEETFAEVLKKNGYKTAFIGKWHLAGEGSAAKKNLKGAIAPEFHPDKQGFDINIGGCAYGQPKGYFDPHNNATIKDRKKGEYLTDRLADEAVNYISNNKNSKFLLYLNPYSVHTPIQAPRDRTEFCKKKLKNKKNAKYAAMVYSVDLMMGRIMETLDKEKLADNTLLIFTSDNGGLMGNAPLRDNKGTLYEGGIRVPYIVRWPGVVKSGSVCNEPVISYDIFPTVLSAAGCISDMPDGIEGQDLTPLLKGKNTFKRACPLIWHYPHYHHGGMGSLDMGSVIRDGDWKLVYCFKNDRTLLFNLKDDISEKKNLSSSNSAKAKELKDKLFSILKELDANMPIDAQVHPKNRK